MSKVDSKVVLLGRHSVGKTCLVERYLHGKFKENTVTTVGAAFGAKKVNVNGKDITLGIWDTAGQERYESMSRIYYRSARAALVCFDLTDRKSFEKVQFWVNELQANEENCEIYIIGTKLDLITEGVSERQIQTKEVEEFSNKIGGKYFETSSKTGEGIEELFFDVAQSYLKKGESVLPPTQKISTKISDNHNSSQDKRCCS